ncbi:MAG: restriction endonuclease [Gemmataceae bacterium]
MFENKTSLWVVHISNHEPSALRAQEEGFICIGWTKIGNLAPHDTRAKMKTAYRIGHPDASDASMYSSYGQVFRFAHEMEVGDPIVYPIKGSREILIGEIDGPYRWAADDQQLVENNYCNVRKVKWFKPVPRISFSQDALHSFSSSSSVATSNDYLEEVIAVLKNDQAIALKRKPVDADMSLAEPAVEVDKIDLADRAVQETEDYLLRQWTRTGRDFEYVVAAVFRAMGYTAQVQQGTHDLGVDVIAHPDPLGVEPPLMKIQAKSGTGKTGAPDVKQLRGLLNQGEKGVLVALAGFANDAKHVQQNDAHIVLIDGERFVELFLEFYDRLDPEIRNQFPLRRVYVFVG